MPGYTNVGGFVIPVVPRGRMWPPAPGRESVEVPTLVYEYDKYVDGPSRVDFLESATVRTPPLPGGVWTTKKSDGGSTSYYHLPEGCKDLQDLIEHKDMRFGRANIFKAAYRLGEQGNDEAYDLKKIIWFAQRRLKELGHTNV